MKTRLGMPDGQPRGAARGLTGWRVLMTLTAFFGTVICANGALVYYALSTFSGEQEASPYEHGLAYDKDIAAALEQDARGWRVSVDALRSDAGPQSLIDVTMRDSRDQPLRGLAVTATLQFPADKKLDRRVALIEFSPGEYRADAHVQPGQWELVIDARQSGERVFRSRNRIILR